MPSNDPQQNRRRLARQLEELDALVLTPLAAARPEIAQGAPSISTWPQSQLAAGAAAALAAGAAASAPAAQGGQPPRRPFEFDWSTVPPSCDPASAIKADATSRGAADDGKQAARARRKRLQVESFAVVLRSLLGPPSPAAAADSSGGCGGDSGGGSATQPGAAPPAAPAATHRNQRRPCVVDFGSGTGNLLLPLAAAWRGCDWVAVEMKPQPLVILGERAREAGLTNVEVFQVGVMHI
jgi:hypothetical protein